MLDQVSCQYSVHQELWLNEQFANFQFTFFLITHAYPNHLVGSGYLTACFAMMVGPEGRAVGIEHIPEIVASAIENVQKSAAAPLLKDGSLSFHVAGMLRLLTGVAGNTLRH